MTPVTVLSLFPTPEDLLALTPEDLGGVIIELMPPLLQNGLFNPAALSAQVYQGVSPSYPRGSKRAVDLAIAEAVSWLVTVGILIPDPGQTSLGFYVPTRRARNLKTRTDVELFSKGRILPNELLPALFAEKVVPLFRRGDHDVAVFQAFKEIEVTVRNTANAKGAGYADSEVGTTLMRKAFNPETGPLTDKSLIAAEREAEMHLFAAAIGHAKNPTSHRDVAMKAPEAARLIVFASHLFDIVERRKQLRPCPMRYVMPNLPCEFEIPDVWLDEAGAVGFVPTTMAYRSMPEAILVPITAIEPPYRVPTVPKDWRGFDRSRFVSVLTGIVTAAEIEPIPLLELPVFEMAPNTYRFRVRNGFHRFYASVVAGFECLSAVIV